MDQDLRPSAEGGETSARRRLQLYIQEELKASIALAKRRIDFQHVTAVNTEEDALTETMQYLDRYSFRGAGDEDHVLLAHQIEQLFITYFVSSGEEARYKFNPAKIIHALAYKVSHVQRSGRLWPEGSWLSSGHHIPNPSWLSEGEVNNVLGLNAARYKATLRAIGYDPLLAPTKDALDQIWHALYNQGSMSMALQTSDADAYAVVSYVQSCALDENKKKKPPATWTTEVDSVLTALVEMKVITEKAVWFDKLASRQYKDSQLWWGAAATMQFLFNPVIVLLPRMSEKEAFYREEVGNTIWGSEEADKAFESFLLHAKDCTECLDSYVLRWALQQDHVLPIAALRTWPRVEHALGASALGLFTSQATYEALVALLTCTFGMFSVLNSRSQYRDLHASLCAAEFLPSSFIREEGSIQIGWVHVSCSLWHYDTNTEDMNNVGSALTEMASCMMELYHLLCKLQTPKQLAMPLIPGLTPMPGVEDAVKLQLHLRLKNGLAYPADWGQDHIVDVATLAWLNSNDAWTVHGDYATITTQEFAALQAHWATSSIRRRVAVTLKAAHGRPDQDSVSNQQFLVARLHALTTLVHTKAAQAPCFAWDDKLVAAILLSSPKLFLDAFTFWEDQYMAQEEQLHLLDTLTQGLRDANVLAENEDVVWEPNTLIVALAMRTKQTVHRVVPRPLGASRYDPVHVSPLKLSSSTEDKRTQKCFAGYFLGHLPLKALEALRFRSKSGNKLPHVNDWVYRTLQGEALKDSNMIVIRQEWTGSAQQQAGQCWHCQRLQTNLHKPPGRGQPPTVTLYPTATCPPHDPCLDVDVLWGVGSFDPLNLASLLDSDYYFGLFPDSIAVLLKHHAGASSTDTMSLHAHALAHIATLGSERVHACSTCHAILLEELDGRPGYERERQLAYMWTMLPLDACGQRIGMIQGSS